MMDRDGMALITVLAAVVVVLALIAYLFLPYLGSVLTISSAVGVGA